MSFVLTAKNGAHHTAPADRVPVMNKLGYGTGMIAYAMMIQAYTQFANPIFNDVLGVNPIWIGWVLGLARFWDAITDPLMGHITDNTRSRWGRRRPWLVIGGLACAISFAAIWWFPRGCSHEFYITWFLVASLIFFTAFTVFSVPYIALGMELSPDYHERTSVMAYRSVLATAGHLLIAGLFWFTSLGIFADLAVGLRWASLLVGVLILVFAILPSLSSHERPTGRPPVAPKKTPLLASIRATIGHWAFLNLVLLTIAALIGLTVVSQLGYYVMVYYVYHGDKSGDFGRVFPLTLAAGSISTVIAIPLLTMLSRRVGKRHTCIIALALAFLGTLLKWPCYSPAHPLLAIIPSILIGAGTAALYSIINAMIPEVVDLDELKTGERREGMFGAIYGWTFKLGVAAAAFLSGYVLPWSGFDVALGAAQSPHAIFLMRVFFTTVPAVTLAGGIVLVFFYPLTEARSYEIRAQLDSRKSIA